MALLASLELSARKTLRKSAGMGGTLGDRVSGGAIFLRESPVAASCHKITFYASYGDLNWFEG